jgi:pimeloyl-ACP methyl ester carboxylesterase
MSVTPPAPLSPLRPQYVRLHDGRALAYLDVGPRDAPPVMHFHGIPCSRLEALWEADSCHELGVRVICPDRPGYGLSDYLPDRSLLDWPADVTALADALGLGRFGVVGVSGGGPYALACAFAMPDRLTGVCVVSGVGRLDQEGALDGVAPIHRLAFGNVRTRPWIARSALGTSLALVKRVPSMMLKLQRCPADLMALRSARPEIASLSFMAESVHRGLKGPLRDAWILAGPWGFEPENVRAEVHLWHGDVDPTVPPRHSLELEALLPHAHLRVCPGEGHLLFAGHLPDIMAAAAGA